MSVLTRGLTAGAAGAGALFAFEPLELRALGREPIYTARNITRALFGRRAEPFSGLVRLGYAMSLGLFSVALWRVRGVLPRSALLTAGIAGAELLALPALGATPRLKRWPRGQRAALVLHAFVFALAAAATSQLRGDR